jgi:hypothetical protein
MHVLLLRPVPGNDRFGLGPFFRIELLGLDAQRVTTIWGGIDPAFRRQPYSAADTDALRARLGFAPSPCGGCLPSPVPLQ